MVKETDNRVSTDHFAQIRERIGETLGAYTRLAPPSKFLAEGRK
jgi:hypothetical protein